MLKHAVGAAVLAGLALGANAVLAGNVAIAPHRAVYDLALKKASERAGLSSAEGRMAIEVGGSSCDGYTVEFRMVNRFKPNEGEVRMNDTRSASWEAGDGHSLRYNQTVYVDNRLDGETKLSAERAPSGGEGSGRIEKPKPEDFTLPAEAIFPMAHQIRLMETAARGGNRDTSLVFDGSDGSKTYRAITFIGARAVNAAPPLASDKLAGMPSWPMSISYYQGGTDFAAEDVPAYQVSFQLYENGVASGVVLDYGEFSLAGTMTNLEFLGEPGCH